MNGHWETMHVLLTHGADPNLGIIRGGLDVTPLHISVEALVNTVRLYNANAETLATEHNVPPVSDAEAPPLPAEMHYQLLPTVNRIRRIISVIVHLKSKGAKEKPDNSVFREVHKLCGETLAPDTMGLLKRLVDREEPEYMGGRFMERNGVRVTGKFTLHPDGKQIVLVPDEGKEKSKNEGKKSPKK